MREKVKLLLQLFISFLRVGALTFGGGYAMLPVLEAEVVDRRKWISDEDLLDFYAIAQTTPGVIVVNTATFIGFTEARYVGAITATLGVITPSIIIITILSFLMDEFSGSPLFQKALLGINVAVTALLVTALVRLGKKSITTLSGGVVALLAFISVQFLGISTIWIILTAGLAGIILSRRKKL